MKGCGARTVQSWLTYFIGRTTARLVDQVITFTKSSAESFLSMDILTIKAHTTWINVKTQKDFSRILIKTILSVSNSSSSSVLPSFHLPQNHLDMTVRVLIQDCNGSFGPYNISSAACILHHHTVNMTQFLVGRFIIVDAVDEEINIRAFEGFVHVRVT